MKHHPTNQSMNNEPREFLQTQKNNPNKTIIFLASKLMYLFLSTNRKEVILAILGSFQYPGNFQPRHSKFPRCIAVVKRPRGDRTNEDCPERPPWKTSFALTWHLFFLLVLGGCHIKWVKKPPSCVTCFWGVKLDQLVKDWEMVPC